MKMRISSRIYNLDFASITKSAFESHFPDSIIPVNGKFVVSKPFVHSKFDKFIYQNTSTYRIATIHFVCFAEEVENLVVAAC